MSALAEQVAILERTPAVFRALMAGVPQEVITADEGPGTFSAFEVLGHLIHGERTDWIPRARIILEHGEARPFEPFDRFAHQKESEGKSVDTLLDEFAQLRAENLRTLNEWKLDDDRLSKTGTHPSLGRVTLRELIATWAVHDLGHIAQASRTMAKHLGDEAGPWREHLRVLDR